ncbi:MAG: hypothetical protein IKT46_02305 [Clostridia bacterium]|nr:hypothetical protein [Clostridia bacterium]
MNSMIYNPTEEFETKFKNLHLQNTNEYFEELVERSGIDIESNRKTIREHAECKVSLEKLKKDLKWKKILRVIMCITLILIPLVIIKMNPLIKELKAKIEENQAKIAELYKLAQSQMNPLNMLFSNKDSLNIIEKTIPAISFDDCFTTAKEAHMQMNFDFFIATNDEQSTTDLISGDYNENPFIYEIRLVHRMGTCTYNGSLPITWTETYRDTDGKLKTRMRSETLTATVTKPKPYYNPQVILNYCAQGGPDLSFTRDASGLDKVNEKQLKRIVKKGEKMLDKKTSKAIKNNQDFMSMSNTEFEVMFDALDRNNEVQFRTLFTPLAQTNMTDLLLSKTGYGDDFNFIKTKRTNKIISKHSQGKPVTLYAGCYMSHSYDAIRESFVSKNINFFKQVYFDFAPIWTIPIYQEKPIGVSAPVTNFNRLFSIKECEALVNTVALRHVAHPDTKTQAILKTSVISSSNGIDLTSVTAYSYDIEKRVDYVQVRGGDGYYHKVPVEWDRYVPLTYTNNFYISTQENIGDKNVISSRKGLYIFT